MAKIVIIIPTYNEGASIGGLVDELEREFSAISQHTMCILIVDGNSSDNTKDVIQQKMSKYNNITLLSEQAKRGLGAAYIFGMRYAVEKMSADAFIEFDGDFQHDPRDIKRVVAEFDSGYDYVIGSRYIKGGSVPKEWAWYRKFISRLGSWVARVALSLPTRDNTSGFKLTRVAGFANKISLDESKMLSLRYAYKIQLLFEMIKLGARVKEIPIVFMERNKGNSKSTIQDVIDSLRVVLSLYKRNKFYEKK